MAQRLMKSPSIRVKGIVGTQIVLTAVLTVRVLLPDSGELFLFRGPAGSGVDEETILIATLYVTQIAVGLVIEDA